MTTKTQNSLGLGALLITVAVISWRLSEARHKGQPSNFGIAGLESKSSAEPALSSNRVNVLAPFHVPNLTAVQAAAFVKENQGSAASLLAAFRTSQDSAYLAEAMQKFPSDPQVALEALFKAGLSPAERRPWIEALKKSAPDNPLGNYLSARDYFNSGRVDLAMGELDAASGRSHFSDLTLERMQMDEEAYRFSGFSEKDCKTAAMFRLELPQLKDMPELARSMVEASHGFRKSGDAASAAAVLKMAVNLGEQFRNSEKALLVNQLLGIGIEQSALESLDPSAAYGLEGGTVQDRLHALKAARDEITNLVRKTVPLQEQMTPQDWVGYLDRMKLFGEQNAMRWLLSKHAVP